MKCDMKLFAAILGELLAAFTYTVIGCLSAEHSSYTFGFGVAAAMQCFLSISGAHINPCVTIAAMILQVVDLPMGFIYILLQLLGSFFGVGLAIVLRDIPDAVNTYCIPQLSVDMEFAIGIELFLTLFWVFAMCASFRSRDSALFDSLPLRMGFVVCALHLAGKPHTGPSMNPFRTLAAHVYMNNFKGDFWIIFVSAPVAGAIGGVLWRFVIAPEKGEDPEAA